MLEVPPIITTIEEVDEPVLLEDIVDAEATQVCNLKQTTQTAVGKAKDGRVDQSGTFPTPPPDTPPTSDSPSNSHVLTPTSTPPLSAQPQQPDRIAGNAEEAQETSLSGPTDSADAMEDPEAAPPSLSLSDHPRQTQSSSSLRTDEEGEVIDVERGQDKPTQEELVEQQIQSELHTSQKKGSGVNTRRNRAPRAIEISSRMAETNILPEGSKRVRKPPRNNDPAVFYAEHIAKQLSDLKTTHQDDLPPPPKYYKDVLKHPYRAQFLAAMELEMSALQSRGV
ncbi:hypothetical protein M501DRAFT_991027 [Patellaria atrata CBS 101060]|uniref:Uncharacterized protein n=1 Tax=Patellaria atrata CBS 101060 TaxID=1346257 RepID=A0A9P4S104_9PEZI|nr:hypothetical protein M501DRAFT_991027 [Patellaria atrata CBS 101060]